MVVVTALVVVLVFMAAEAAWSRRQARVLVARGAVEPAGDTYRLMRIVYPGIFLAMAGEDFARGGPSALWLAVGIVVFALAKALKVWTICSLGSLWSFRLLVLKGQRLVVAGPYRFLRHPNYVSVVGEILGAALIFGAPVAGLVGLVVFGELLRRRIRLENQALHPRYP
jgi:methyltransferase